MKKIIFLPLIFLVVNCKDLHAQTLKDSPEQLIAPALSNYYTGKAKQQKTAGLVLTGLGVAMVVAGFALLCPTLILDYRSMEVNPPRVHRTLAQQKFL